MHETYLYDAVDLKKEENRRVRIGKKSWRYTTERGIDSYVYADIKNRLIVEKIKNNEKKRKNGFCFIYTPISGKLI